MRIWAGSPKLLVAAVFILPVVFSAQGAYAGVISEFSGSTYVGSVDVVDATIYFSVYQNTDTSGDPWGTGVPDFDGLSSFDPGAEYLFLYQAVNTGQNGYDISSNSVSVDRSTVTSWSVIDSPFTLIDGELPTDFPTLSLTDYSLVADYNYNQNKKFNPNDVSAVWGFTSNYGPVWGTTALLNHGTSSNGVVPTAAVPEPALVILLGIGIAAVTLGTWKMR